MADLEDTHIMERVGYFLDRYGDEYGEGHLVLATHAAYPPVMTMDLLYQLWANFKTYESLEGRPVTIPILAVSDVILSSFFRQTGKDFYEMDAAVRAYLLNDLKEDLRFGPPRILELAAFLYQYTRSRLQAPEWENFNQVQQWTALMTVDPAAAAGKVVDALRLRLAGGAPYASIGIVNLIGNLLREKGAGAEQMAEQLKSLVIDKDAGAQTVEVRLPGFLKERIREAAVVAVGMEVAEAGIVAEPEVSYGSVAAEAEPAVEESLRPTVYHTLVAIPSYEQTGRVGNAFEGAIDRLHDLLMGGGSNVDTQLLLTDQATKENLRIRLGRVLSEARDQDIVFLYFAVASVREGYNEHRLRLYNNGTLGVHELREWLRPDMTKQLTIILMLDCDECSSDWLEEDNPLHIQLLARQPGVHLGWGGTRTPAFTEVFCDTLEASGGRLTYRSLCRQIMEAMVRRSANHDLFLPPVFVASGNTWDNQVFSHAVENKTQRIAVLLAATGYLSKHKFQEEHQVPDEDDTLLLYLGLKSHIQGENTVKLVVMEESGKDGLFRRFIISGAEKYKMDFPETGSGADEISSIATECYRRIAEYDVLVIDLRGGTGGLPPDHWIAFAFALGKMILLVTTPGLHNWDKLSLRHRPNTTLLPCAIDDDFVWEEGGKGALYIDRLVALLAGSRFFARSKRLDLSERKLDAIPEDVFLLDDLEELLLQGNNISVIPRDIVRLRHLKVLNLNSNPIVRLPEELLSLQELEVLSLSNTELEELPVTIDLLLALKELHVHSTPLVMLPVSLTLLPNLELLDARECRILNVPRNVLNHRNAPGRLKTYAKGWNHEIDEDALFLSIGMGQSVAPAWEGSKGMAMVHNGVKGTEELFNILQTSSSGLNFIYLKDDDGVLQKALLSAGKGDFAVNGASFFRDYGSVGARHLIYDGPFPNAKSLDALVGANGLQSIIYNSDREPMSDEFLSAFFDGLLTGITLAESFDKASKQLQGYFLIKGRTFVDDGLAEPEESKTDTAGVGLSGRAGLGELLAMARNTGVINLAGRGLSELPPEIFELKGLRSLNISGNPLTTLPEELFELAYLESLTVENTLIRVIPCELSRLKGLIYFKIMPDNILNIPKGMLKPREAHQLVVYLAPRPRLTKDPNFPLILNVRAIDAAKGFDDCEKVCQKNRTGKTYLYHSEKGCRSLPELADLIREYLYDGSLLIVADEGGRLAGAFGSGPDKDRLVYEYFSSFGLRLNLIYIGPLQSENGFTDLITHRKMNSVIAWKEDRMLQNKLPTYLLELMLEQGYSLLEALRRIEGNDPYVGSFEEPQKKSSNFTYDIYYNAQQFEDLRLMGAAAKGVGVKLKKAAKAPKKKPKKK